MDIVEFIKKLQIRPGMYIGDLNFTNLKHYIDHEVIEIYDDKEQFFS